MSQRTSKVYGQHIIKNRRNKKTYPKLIQTKGLNNHMLEYKPRL